MIIYLYTTYGSYKYWNLDLLVLQMVWGISIWIISCLPLVTHLHSLHILFTCCMKTGIDLSIKKQSRTCEFGIPLPISFNCNLALFTLTKYFLSNGHSYIYMSPFASKIYRLNGGCARCVLLIVIDNLI